jgi:hypothetical protein
LFFCFFGLTTGISVMDNFFFSFQQRDIFIVITWYIFFYVTMVLVYVLRMLLFLWFQKLELPNFGNIFF